MHTVNTKIGQHPRTLLLIISALTAALGTACGGSTSNLPCDGNSATVRFVAVGDTGKGNAGQLEVAAGIEKLCLAQGCDFVLLLGDNIYESGVSSVDDPQWKTKFEDPYKNIPVPFYAILGNHDYGGNGAGNEFGKGAIEVDYTNHSTKWKMPASYYGHSTAAVDFFALDTNILLFDQEIANQKTALATWISSSTAPWKIAAGHHPYRSNGPHGNAGNYDGVSGSGQQVRDFIEANVCGQVDLYLSGHDHSQQWLTDTCKGTQIVVSGAGASPTTLPGANAADFQSTALGFLYLEAKTCGTARSLTATFFDTTGKANFSKTLTK